MLKKQLEFFKEKFNEVEQNYNKQLQMKDKIIKKLDTALSEYEEKINILTKNTD